MLNYIKSEIYRMRKCKPFWILMGIITLLDLWMFLECHAIAMASSIFDGQAWMADLVSGMFSFLLFVPLLLTVFLHGAEDRERTIKHGICFGYSRVKIYFARLFSTLLFSIGAYLWVYVLTSFFMLFLPPVEGVNAYAMMWTRAAYALPNMIGMAAMQEMVLMVIGNTGMSLAAGFSWWVVVPFLLSQFGMKYEICAKMYKLTPFYILDANCDMGLIAFGFQPKILITGLVYTVVFTLIGVLVYRKKEIQ